MKIFQCDACGQALYFENTHCEKCGHRLGFVPFPDSMDLGAIEPEGALWRRLGGSEERYRFCANAAHDTCNWLIEADAADRYCRACRHNLTVPDLSGPDNLRRWQKLEIAKHRLVYSLLRLGLDPRSRAEAPRGLAFDFLADPPDGGSVMTGHDNGLITIALAEADDAERERRRTQMGEPYRTLLGHFRHEVGHYFWDVLVRDDPSLKDFRTLFGDERRDYGEALKEHYANGAPADWPDRFISAYATSHPWEDFAETWAHYLHMVDTLETARAIGLHVAPDPGAPGPTAVDRDPYTASEVAPLVAAWVPVTLAINSLNRSMGQPDLYPFVLSPPVVGKLSFIHQRIHRRDG